MCCGVKSLSLNSGAKLVKLPTYENMKQDSLKNISRIKVDRGLIKLFLKMTPEERLLSNDRQIRAILELQNAYKQKTSSNRSKHTPDRAE